MIKLIIWFLKYIVIGPDPLVDTQFSMEFDEAYRYLKRGYFIKNAYHYGDNLYYLLVDDNVYEFNAKNKSWKKIDGFSSLALMAGRWYVCSIEHITEKRKGND